MLLIKTLIAINILYLVIEDFRTKTVNIYFCISLFILSSIYAICFSDNVTNYLDNLLAGTLFLVFIYISSVKLQNRVQSHIEINFITEADYKNKGLSYLPIVFLGYLIYELLDFNTFFATYLKTLQLSMDFLALPLCIIISIVIFVQLLRCYFNRDKQIIIRIGDGDIWAIMGVVGFIPVGEFFIIIFLANIIYILIYVARKFLCS